MKICFVGLDNLPVLSEEYNMHGIGGEQVQQTLLAKAFASRGHQVSMIVYDYGQPKIHLKDGITAYRAFRQNSGIPVIRFFHPRWTKTWAALRQANADVYYSSCAGMQLGLLALFCKQYDRRLVFRVAHDSDCRPSDLLIKYKRDIKIYEYGLARANKIFVQTLRQQADLLKNYGRTSSLARMLVQPALENVERDVDVLWVNNVRQFKRPDLFIELVKRLPKLRFRMVGGEQQDSKELYSKIMQEAKRLPNLTFCGRVPYHAMWENYARARVFVNTSDSEGFPNSYLQAWAHGTPTVVFFDPDNIISEAKLGLCATSIAEMAEHILFLLKNQRQWERLSDNCRAFMARNYLESDVIAPYLAGIKEVLGCPQR